MNIAATRFWRDVTIVAIISTFTLLLLDLVRPVTWLSGTVVVVTALAAVLATTLFDLRALRVASRWVESLGTPDANRTVCDLDFSISENIAGSIMALSRDRDHLRTSLADIRDLHERLIATIPDPVLVIDREDIVLKANRAAQDAFGISPGELSLRGLFRDPGLLAAVESARSARRSSQLVFSPAGGPDRRFVARIEPASSHKGGRDVLLYLREENELVMIERMRSDFVANVSHELKTPLATLIGFIETLRGPARDDMEARENFLEIMADEAGRMSHLVDDLLSLSEIELAATRLPDEPCDLSSVLSEVSNGIQPIAAARDVEIVLEGEPGIAIGARRPGSVAPGDRQSRGQRNKIWPRERAGDHRGHASRASTGDAGSLASSAALSVSVIDDGPGIASEHLARLTERFYRADKARSRRVGGTGLGLAIVKHIVRRHQGHLAIASEVGKGSRFTIYLPIMPQVPAV